MAVLTDAKARNIKPEDKVFAHGGIVGLSLIAGKQKGRGKWVLRYVSPITKKRRNMGLGTYPEISVAEAGRLGAEAREQLGHGIDPLEEKAKLVEFVRIESTKPIYEDAACQVFETLSSGWKNAKHKQQWINTQKTYVFPFLGKKRLEEITPADVAETLKPIWLEKPETASRVKQRIHAVMAWGWAHGFCQGNPVDVVDKLLPTQTGKAIRVQHFPAMPWRDISAFVHKNLLSNMKFNVTRALL